MSLDIPFRQVAIDFFQDPNDFRWHHRVLLLPSGEPDGRWIVLTPDGEVEVARLADHRVRPLARNAPFPEVMAGQLYHFDPLGPGELDGYLEAARELASIVGFTSGAAAEEREEGQWLVADAALASFGSRLPAAALQDEDAVVLRDKSGLAFIDNEWVLIQKVPDDEVAGWKLAKAEGGAIDRRVLPVRRARAGEGPAGPAPAAGQPRAGGPAARPYRDEHAAQDEWKDPKDPHFPLKGPRLLREFMAALRASGLTLILHHLSFVSRSGISERGGIAREHKCLCEALRHWPSRLKGHPPSPPAPIRRFIFQEGEHC